MTDNGAAMDKWAEWARKQRENGNVISIDNANEHAACIKIKQHEGPDTYMTVSPEAARIVVVIAGDTCVGCVHADDCCSPDHWNEAPENMARCEEYEYESDK